MDIKIKDDSRMYNCISNHVGIMNDEMIIYIINIYFHINGFFEYEQECDDVINIIYQYIAEKSIIIGNNHSYINTGHENAYFDCIDTLDKNLIVTPACRQMLSKFQIFYKYIINYTIQCH